ncbi:DinB family protein [Rossellomorea aquimaris]|uniref:DinB family protein n=1 Tax=Rossellomorea aquimaris TaxID=189382 RepID=UPI0007D04318|nr:DinB family protein [Rossellomorea aquimaris]
MNTSKQEILSHHTHFIEWVKSLNTLSNEQWRAPMEENKWSISETVGHLIPWDEFVLEMRIPYFRLDNVILPPAPDVEELNRQSSETSRHQTREETLASFISKRQGLMEAISQLEDDLWTRQISIGPTKITLKEYFTNLAQHDHHHLNQIKNFLQK